MKFSFTNRLGQETKEVELKKLENNKISVCGLINKGSLVPSLHRHGLDPEHRLLVYYMYTVAHILLPLKKCIFCKRICKSICKR